MISNEEILNAVNQLYNKLENFERQLLEMSNVRQSESDPNLTVEQAAEMLHISVATLYGLTRRREIPFSKPGKRLFFSRQDLIGWIRSKRMKTHAESALEAERFVNSRNGVQLPLF